MADAFPEAIPWQAATKKMRTKLSVKISRFDIVIFKSKILKQIP